MQLKHGHGARCAASDPGFSIKSPVVTTDSSQPQSGHIFVVGVSRDEMPYIASTPQSKLLPSW